MTDAQTTLQISADFDSGNIRVVDASDSRHVRLAIRPDTQSDHFQWFHFKVSGLVPGTTHGFHLENAGQSSYPTAWAGYHAVASYDQRTWFRVPSRFEAGALSFDFEAREPQAWFAYFEPYSRERHAQLIERAQNQAGMQLLALGKSIEGRNIELLRKGSGTDPALLSTSRYAELRRFIFWADASSPLAW